MKIKEYSYKYNKYENRPFEIWMTFAATLASYIKQYKGNLKVYLSLPERQLFTPFFIFGCVDYDIQSRKSVFQSQLVESLVSGDTIRYLENGQWISMAFENFKESEEKGKVIEVKGYGDRTKRELIEQQWNTFLRIPNKNNIVMNVPELGEIYGEEHMKEVVTFSTPLTYLSTIKTQWYEIISGIHLNLNNVDISCDTFFRSETNTYNNLDFLSTRKFKLIDEVLQNVIVCDGTLKSLNYITNVAYKNHKQVYIIDRMETEERIELVKNQFKSMILEHGLINKNEEFLEYVNKLNIVIPKGVELYIAAHSS